MNAPNRVYRFSSYCRILRCHSLPDLIVSHIFLYSSRGVLPDLLYSGLPECFFKSVTGQVCELGIDIFNYAFTIRNHY